MSDRITMTHVDWTAEAIRRFGEDPREWRFVCPLCKHVAAAKDWKAASAPEGAVAFACVGRWLRVRREAFAVGDGPCNYTGGGLFGLNPVAVVFDDGGEPLNVFAFADPTVPKAGEGC